MERLIKSARYVWFCVRWSWWSLGMPRYPACYRFTGKTNVEALNEYWDRIAGHLSREPRWHG